MIAVIQRVLKAAISVDDNQIAEIDNGLVIFLGVMSDDDETDCQFLHDKIAHFRIFNDDNEKMNLSVSGLYIGAIAEEKTLSMPEKKRNLLMIRINESSWNDWVQAPHPANNKGIKRGDQAQVS